MICFHVDHKIQERLRLLIYLYSKSMNEFVKMDGCCADVAEWDWFKHGCLSQGSHVLKLKGRLGFIFLFFFSLALKQIIAFFYTEGCFF